MAAVANMNTMFYFATAFNQNIGRWNVASVSGMNSAFASAVSFNYNLAAWNVDRVVDLTGSFDSTTALDDCYKRGVYYTWGSTMEAAYPAWSSLCTTIIRAGWSSLNSMPITAKYGAQMAHSTDDGSRIYVAAAWESTSETSTPNFESYMKYTTLTDTWLSGAPRFVARPVAPCAMSSAVLPVRSQRRAV